MITITLGWGIKIVIILGTLLGILGSVGPVIGVVRYYFKSKNQTMEKLHQAILSNPQFKEDLDEILEENYKKKRKFLKEETNTYKVVSFRKYVIKNASKYSTELTKEELKAYYKAFNQYLKVYKQYIETMFAQENSEEDFSETIQDKRLFKKFFLHKRRNLTNYRLLI